MNRLHYIRTEIFGMNQTEFAAAIGKAQGTISRWELDVDNPMLLVPDIEDWRRIKAAAKQRRLMWRDKWIFDTPQPNREEQAKSRAWRTKEARHGKRKVRRVA